MSRAASESPGAPTADGTSAIVFFDGECGFCARSVRFLMDRDSRGCLRYAPLQGETAARVVPPEYRESLGTMLLLEGGELRARSTAALRALALLGGGWAALAKLALCVPRALRDPLYSFVARNRHRLAGARSACRLPTAEEQRRLLP